MHQTAPINISVSKKLLEMICVYENATPFRMQSQHGCGYLRH